MPSQKQATCQPKQECHSRTTIPIVYGESGPCLVVKLSAQECNAYPGMLQRWEQQGEMQTAVLAALLVQGGPRGGFLIVSLFFG